MAFCALTTGTVRHEALRLQVSLDIAAVYTPTQKGYLDRVFWPQSSGTPA